MKSLCRFKMCADIARNLTSFRFSGMSLVCSMDRKQTARTMRKECSSDVSSRSFGGALRDIQKTAARETSWNAARDH